MKKYFGCFYFLFYVLSLMVLEIFFDANTFFNYAIFMGFVLFLEIMSWFILYIIYKVSNYYNLQNDRFNRNKCIFLISKRMFSLSMIGFFLVFFLSRAMSNLVIGSDELFLNIRLSSLMFLILPIIGLFRGILYTLGYKKVVYISYIACSFFQFIFLFLVTLICYFAKIESVYLLILSVGASYLVVYLYLLFYSKRCVKIDRNRISFNFFGDNINSLISRINVYNFVFVFIFLFLFMGLDVFYGKVLLSTGMIFDDVKKFSIITVFVGPLFNIIFMFCFICIYGKTKVTKDNFLLTVIGLLKISLPVTVFISLVYNYYTIYKYFIYLVPLQLGCLLALIFLYNQNKRKIIFNAICLMFFIKQFFNIILLNSFRYTGISNYNAFITSNILTYLVLIVILLVYSVKKFKLSGEIFVRSFFDMAINLVFSVSILLILKSFFYYNNLFFAILYVVIGMSIYIFIPKILKYF